MIKAYKSRVLKHKNDFLWIGVGLFIQLVSGLFTIKFLTRSLGSEQYGMLALFLSGVQLVESVVFSPLLQGANRFAFYESSIQYAFQTIVPACNRLFFIMFILVLAGFTYFFWQGETMYSILILLAIPMIYFDIRKEFIFAIYAIDRKRKFTTQMRAIEQLLKITFILTLFYLVTINIVSVISGVYLATTAILFLLLLRLSKKSYPINDLISDVKTKYLQKKIIQFAIPMALVAIVAWVHTWADRWILNNHLGLNSVGIYTSYVQIASVPFNMLASLMAAFFVPIVFKQVADIKTIEEYNVFRTKIQYMLWGYMVLSIALLGFILLIRVVVLKALLPNNYIVSGVLLFYISLGTLFVQYSQMQTVLSLNAAGESRFVLYANIIAALIYLLLLLILIEKYSIEGVAFSFILSNIIKCILLYFFSKKSWRNFRDNLLPKQVSTT